MSQETTGDAAPAEVASAQPASETTPAPCQSPPPAPMPAREESTDPRTQLL